MLSSFSLRVCLSIIFSSIVLGVTSLKTYTTLVWPILCARSIAWRSICGFQSLSYNTTMFALIRLRPRPPARVDIKKTFTVLPGFTNSSIYCSRSSRLVFPSRRQYSSCLKLQKSSKISSIDVNPEKMSI